jgi:hypothetical protein
MAWNFRRSGFERRGPDSKSNITVGAGLASVTVGFSGISGRGRIQVPITGGRQTVDPGRQRGGT